MSRERIEAIYPLSPLQRGMLYHSLAEPGSGVYVEELACEIHGALDVAAFERAWRLVVARHAVLRTSFVWEGLDEPLQVVHAHVEVPLERWESGDAAGERDLDLARPPLVRLGLQPLGAGAQRFTWRFHHALLDGWSSSLLLREVLAAYAVLALGREPALAPPREYREWIAWLRTRDHRAAEAFWRRRLAGFRSPTPLPGARLAGAREGPGRAVRSLRLSPAATAALLAFGREHRLTQGTLLLGAWALLLARASGEDDVVLGTTLSGRGAELAAMDERVGLFINTLPVRARITRAARGLPWLAALQQELLELWPFEWSALDDVQRWSDVPRGVRLFDTLVVLENYPGNSLAPEACSGLEIRGVELAERTSHALALVVAPDSELELTVCFDPALFDGCAIEGLLCACATLLAALVERPHERLERLPLAAEPERRRLLGEWNDSAREFPSHACVHELFEEQVERAPHAVALVFGDVELTYRELDRRANRLAQRLRSLGVAPEARVAVLLERSLDLVVALVAILKAGGAYVPLDPASPRERLAWLLDDVGATAIVTCSALLGELPRRTPPIVALDAEADAIARMPDARLPGAAHAASLAYVIHTSGSTGAPKGIAVTHRAIVRLVRSTDYVALGEDDRIALASSAAFDAATFEIWGALLNGARLVGIEREVLLSPLELERELRARGITTLFLTTALVNALAGRAPGAFAALRQLLFGGEAVDPQRVRALLEHGAPRRLLHVYGPTEATTFSSWHLVEAVPEGAATIPIGRPLANARLHVLDRHLELVPVGLPGELFIGGEGLARGYIGRPDATAEAFVPDPFASAPGERLYRTGDLVRRLPDGALEFLGRLDDQVKLRGFRIEPAEVAAVLRRHEGVQDAAVVVREDAPGERRLAAYFVARGEPAPSAEELRSFASTRLPDYMVPAAIVRLDALPLNRSGKLDRAALPAPAHPTPDADGAYVAPRNAVERALARIWAELLGRERVGVHDSFFLLGGDSILTIQVVSRAREQGILVTPRQIFEHPTLAALAALAGTGAAAAREALPVSGSAPLTPIQQWFFAQDLPERHHFDQSVLLELRARLDPALLERALERLTAHHDALRLRFERAHAGWRQFHADAPVAVPLERVDLARAAPGDHAAAIEAASSALQAALDIERGPLARAALFDLGDARPMRLLLVVHHLAVDAVSWSILLEDLETALDALRRGEPPALPPKTASFRDHALALADLARSDELAREADHWLAPSRRAAARLPLDHPGGSNREADARTVTVLLDADATRALVEELPRTHRARVDEALLAALALALAGWSDAGRHLVDVEHHGRGASGTGGDELDLSRTVGWFTAIFPVLLDVERRRAPAEALRAVKEALRAVPRQGIGYGLLRHSGARPELAARLAELPAAEVSFNYLGHTDAALARSALFAEASEQIGPCFGPRGARPHLIALDASVSGGRLCVEWSYSGALHRRETIEALARAFLDALRALLAPPREPAAVALSPSDFPDADLDQEELDALVTRLRGTAR